MSKDARMHLRMSAEDKQALQKAAEARGIKVSELIRVSVAIAIRFSGLNAALVRDLFGGPVETVCHDCINQSDHIESGGPVFPTQPDRANYKTMRGYIKALERLYRCNRCGTELSFAQSDVRE